MFVERSRQANPYATYQAFLLQRGLLGDRGKALMEPEPRLAQLSATSLKAQMLANAERFERLGSALSGLLPTLSELANPDQAPAVRMVAKIQVTKPTDGERFVATPATLLALTPIDLPAGPPETMATMTSDAPRLSLGTGTAATAATLTLGKVALNTTQSTTAELRGENIALPQKSPEADFGAVTINGVTTSLGVFSGKDERLAAQFIADRLNSNQANTVTASVEKNGKRVTLSAKVPGTAGNFSIEGERSDSDGNLTNDFSPGFRVGDRAEGKDGGSTDFGSVTINGVTTSFGVRSNDQQTPQTAAQWLVDRLNTTTLNDFMASVGGTDQDQVVLTAKTLGLQGRLKIDQVTADSDGDPRNEGTSGFMAGWSAVGQDADAGSTDLGSVTISGVKTSFGRLSNAGLTAQAAARFMVERLNANASNPVLASLGGNDLDRVVLTAKAPGSAGAFRIDQSSSDANGWVAGRVATGQDATSGTADFGSITINGITTRLGVLDGRQHTVQSAMQYLLDRLNQTNSTITAREQDGRILLSSKDTGSQAKLTIEAVTSESDGDTSNDRGLGFVPGQAAVGKDERPPASAPIKIAYERIVDQGQVSRMVAKTGQVVKDLNRYLQALKEDQPPQPKSVQGFRAEWRRTLHQEEATFSQLGIQVQDDRLVIDDAALEMALQEDPHANLDHFKRLNQALEPIVGSQAFALEHMRAAAKTTGEEAATISHVAASLYKMQHRANKLGWVLEQMSVADDTLRDQRERIQKTADGKRAERDDHGSPDRGIDREPSRSAPWRAPRSGDFFGSNPASPGSEARWPDGR